MDRSTPPIMEADEAAAEILRLSGEVAALRLALLGLLAKQDIPIRRAVSAALHQAAANAQALRPISDALQVSSDDPFGQLSRACHELAASIDQAIELQN